MSMSKKDFISLANIIKGNKDATGFTPDAILLLSHWCGEQNPRFKRVRWLDYIAGECGPNGGAIKQLRAVNGRTTES